MEYDFSGYATKNDLRCSDGRIIRKNAFADNDGTKVPLVWNHKHNDPFNVLGHAELENREDGVYAYCTFNNTEVGQQAKEMVKHGDVTSLSIFANKLKENAGNVVHGVIREVSLVLAGANPGARIDNVICHSDTEDSEEATLCYFEPIDNSLQHAKKGTNSRPDDYREYGKNNRYAPNPAMKANVDNFFKYLQYIKNKYGFDTNIKNTGTTDKWVDEIFNGEDKYRILKQLSKRYKTNDLYEITKRFENELNSFSATHSDNDNDILEHANSRPDDYRKYGKNNLYIPNPTKQEKRKLKKSYTTSVADGMNRYFNYFVDIAPKNIKNRKEFADWMDNLNTTNSFDKFLDNMLHDLAINEGIGDDELVKGYKEFLKAKGIQGTKDGMYDYMWNRFKNKNLKHSDTEGENMDDTLFEEFDFSGFNNADYGFEHADENNKTVEDIFNTLTEEQKQLVYALVGMAQEEASKSVKHSFNEEDETLKHNIFDTEYNNGDELMHAEGLGVILGDAKTHGTLKESFLAHADEYGITNIDYLFPEATNLNPTPEFIKRKTDWVSDVMDSVHRSPFSRIKSTFADITADEARAKGYMKGKLKKEEVFSLLKRTTTPTTIYKKQKMDRDDVIDITDFDVVAWIKGEMRLMLDEEIARAILVGDGRLSSDDDKISEDHIRPVATDAELYTIQKVVTPESGESVEHAFISAAIKARKDYRGSGSPTLYIQEDLLADLLLMEDTIGHTLYKSVEELATKLRVKKIVEVPVLPSNIYGIIVNLSDYNLGADKGGAINMFDDFDIDYNQMKYLIETRASGALVKPYSAITLKSE